ncbi:Dabb family protein [Mycobacterium aquaticum]|uniref:Stress protein n=1 Tax=Mycobacterium aquaticum TaxID=1927124 RepID=A0A1X0A8W0_9MYCO|nr:Dabb family protein [Mycobacterium aquaticum]ORA26308.1 stress protein [Mycobacterium aquaticum]
MFVHQFRFSFKDESTEEQRAEVLAILRRIASVDSVSFGAVGQNLGDPVEGLTHAYFASFEDLNAFERYLYEPVHLEGDPQIVPHFKKLAIGPEMSDDMDPDLNAKVAALHERKMAKYPEWGALMAVVPEMRFV